MTVRFNPADTASLLFKRLLAAFHMLIERVRGPKVMEHIYHPTDSVGRLVASAIFGYELSIYCKRIRYQRKFKRWWVPTQTIDLYEISSRASSNAPTELLRACEVTVVLPALLPAAVDTDLQAHAVIEAYLDILGYKLQGFAPTVSLSH